MNHGGNREQLRGVALEAGLVYRNDQLDILEPEPQSLGSIAGALMMRFVNTIHSSKGSNCELPSSDEPDHSLVCCGHQAIDIRRRDFIRFDMAPDRREGCLQEGIGEHADRLLIASAG